MDNDTDPGGPHGGSRDQIPASSPPPPATTANHAAPADSTEPPHSGTPVTTPSGDNAATHPQISAGPPPAAPPPSDEATPTGVDDFTSAANASGAIIITINYVFSDENNPVNPNRTGALVMTVPNVSANRDPRLLDEFVRLATQMAYSSIVNGFKDRGVTIAKFEAFPTKTVEELPADSRNCSICFESYDVFNAAANIHASHGSCKRRKLDTPDAAAAPASEASTSAVAPKYLSDSTKEFPHYPVQMPCGHIFGQSCLAYWLKSHTTCPLCRDIIRDGSDAASTTDASGPAINSTTINTHNYGIANSWNNGASNVRLIGRNGLNELLDSLHQNYRAFNRGHDSASVPEPTATEPEQEQDTAQTSEDASAFTRSSRDAAGVFSNMLAYIRRRRQFPPAEPLFPTVVASQRTRTGIQTRTVDANSSDEILDFLNLRPLTEDTPNDISGNAEDNNTTQTPNDGAEDDDHGN